MRMDEESHWRSCLWITFIQQQKIVWENAFFLFYLWKMTFLRNHQTCHNPKPSSKSQARSVTTLTIKSGMTNFHQTNQPPIRLIRHLNRAPSQSQFVRAPSPPFTQTLFIRCCDQFTLLLIRCYYRKQSRNGENNICLLFAFCSVFAAACCAPTQIEYNNGLMCVCNEVL